MFWFLEERLLKRTGNKLPRPTLPQRKKIELSARVVREGRGCSLHVEDMAVNLGLGWLCILFVVFSINTVISSYCVALSHGHIFPFLPAISETGVLYPEKYIFRELGNLSGFLFVANAYIRYLQYKLVSEQCPEEHPTLNRLNMLAFITAICSGTGITFVANFEVQKVCSVDTVLFRSPVFLWERTYVHFSTLAYE